jgi:hypothetical protein
MQWAISSPKEKKESLVKWNLNVCMYCQDFNFKFTAVISYNLHHLGYKQKVWYSHTK